MANILDRSLTSIGTSPNGGVGYDKVKKFNWADPGEPGRLMWLNKNVLNIDDTYQREERSKEAIVRIARDFSWMLFEPLMIALRSDGTHWVIEGGHRARGVMLRGDIQEVPCFVFRVDEIAKEAQAFINGAKNSNSISAFHTFRASVAAGFENAVKTKQILDRLGLVAAKQGSGSPQIKCVAAVQKAVADNAELAERCLEACIKMAGTESVDGYVFKGLFIACRKCPGRDILSEFSEKLAMISQLEMKKAIRLASVTAGKGGEFIAARAVTEILNKGMRSKKIVWE